MKKKTQKTITAKQKREWFDAVSDNDIKITKKMLAQGFDINAQSSFGWTALHFASYYGNFAIAGFLIKHGANVNAQKADLRTPLHLALFHGHTNIAKLLIDNEANITIKDDDGDTPLYKLRPRQMKYQELVEWLSEYHPEKALELMSSENIQGKGVGL